MDRSTLKDTDRESQLASSRSCWNKTGHNHHNASKKSSNAHHFQQKRRMMSMMSTFFPSRWSIKPNISSGSMDSYLFLASHLPLSKNNQHHLKKKKKKKHRRVAHQPSTVWPYGKSPTQMSKKPISAFSVGRSSFTYKALEGDTSTASYSND